MRHNPHAAHSAAFTLTDGAAPTRRLREQISDCERQHGKKLFNKLTAEGNNWVFFFSRFRMQTYRDGDVSGGGGAGGRGEGGGAQNRREIRQLVTGLKTQSKGMEKRQRHDPSGV